MKTAVQTVLPDTLQCCHYVITFGSRTAVVLNRNPASTFVSELQAHPLWIQAHRRAKQLEL